MDEHKLAELVATNDVSIVKFYADWCAPCKQMDPIVGAYSAEHGIPVFHVNIEESPELAAKMGVMSIPTIVYFVDGEEADRMIGAGPIRFSPTQKD